MPELAVHTLSVRETPGIRFPFPGYRTPGFGLGLGFMVGVRARARVRFMVR
jgi:hypothetical protein